jgi:hypothetical protein
MVVPCVHVVGRAIGADTRLLQTSQFILLGLCVTRFKVNEHPFEFIYAITKDNMVSAPR